MRRDYLARVACGRVTFIRFVILEKVYIMSREARPRAQTCHNSGSCIPRNTCQVFKAYLLVSGQIRTCQNLEPPRVWPRYDPTTYLTRSYQGKAYVT